MCVDLNDLNKAFPKDNHPLPKIDGLVDSTTAHELLYYTSAGYNPTSMAEKHRIHTTFVTAQGVYNYKMMPFGIKGRHINEQSTKSSRNNLEEM